MVQPITSYITNRIKRPDAVIFDWDDTLFNHDKINHYLSMKLIEDIGPKTSSQDELNRLATEMNNSWHEDKDACCRKYFGGRSVDEVFAVWNTHMETIPVEELRMLDNAREVLESLKEKGIPMMIVSNKPERFLERELKHFELNQYFDVVIGQQKDVKERKPSALPVFKAIDELNKKRKGAKQKKLEHNGRLWYVGDHFDDASAAIGAGTSVFIIGDAHKKNIDKHFCDSDAIGGITHLKDLHAFKEIVDTIPQISPPSL